MATADCAISVGFRSSAEPGSTNTASCSTIVGFASAATPVAWAGNEGSRNIADWLPRIDEPVIDPKTGKFTRRWWNYFRELGERMGGVQGPSVTQIVSEVAATQVQVANNANYTTQVADYAQGIAAVADATAQVATSNSLSGAGSIPETPERPTRSDQQAL